MSAEPTPPDPSASAAAFIARWAASGGAERANYQLFLAELCPILGVPTPDPTCPDDSQNQYVFERNVRFQNGDGTESIGRIDLYRRGSFVLEAKQGTEAAARAGSLLAAPARLKRGSAIRGTQGWDAAMLAARGQAEQYAKALPPEEGWPPFLVVVDVGHSIELYADFTRSGKTYIPYPDPRSHRIALAELAKAETRELLRALWLEPLSLDPSRRTAKVTREVAARLADLAKSLEAAGHEAEHVAQFLMRCLFTMFAEDVRLLPEGAFERLLNDLRSRPDVLPDAMRSLWRDMDRGGFSAVLKEKILRFNGGLFEHPEALPLTEPQIDLLIQAAKADWRHVEPAIFGTLLERALNPVERHKLGAHYTPRAYVERLVLPTVVEPLREEWSAVQAAAVAARADGDNAGAVEVVKAFHLKLCSTRVLDPACGSGNFLYVTLEHLKRLEGEVLDLLNGLGQQVLDYEEQSLAVDPHQLLGIEVNPRAAAIADLVLWIGYLQWHFRTRGDALPREPVLHNFRNIECRDAVLAYDGTEPMLDDQGNPVTRWDGRTTKKHPVTGEDVPDETARIPVLRYLNPRKAEWPAADYVVGNPPFVGKLYLLSDLGEGYVAALRSVYDAQVQDGADFVMYWWFAAAELISSGALKRFGFITTNSITQLTNRRLVLAAMNAKSPVHIAYAIPNHPWVDATDAADVRIAMTVGSAGTGAGILEEVIVESGGSDGYVDATLDRRLGIIHADLRIGANLTSASALTANRRISGTGLILGSRGFVVDESLGLQLQAGVLDGRQLLYPIMNGRDLNDIARGLHVIDTHGIDEEELRGAAPAIYQRLRDRVFPERQTNRDPRVKARWWLFRRTNEQIRAAIHGLKRYIATSETSRHRIFSFLDATVRPEHKLVVIGTDDALVLAVLSSRIHVAWALEAGGRLGVGNDPVYAKTLCFETYPFPAAVAASIGRIRELGEALDAHRKRQQAQHPGLTLTDMYNVLAKLRSGEPLTAKDKVIHEQGLVSVLKQIHDDLDAAVFEAYGWPPTLTDEEILERLVALNAERAREERNGLIRWLRPEFQNPQGGGQSRLIDDEGTAPVAAAAKTEKRPWPKSLPEQVAAVRAALVARGTVVSAEELARDFVRAKAPRVGELLAALAAVGQAREVAAGRFAS